MGEIPEQILEFSPEEVANASGYIRANSSFHLATVDDITFLRSLKSPTVGQKANKLLHALAARNTTPGKDIKIPFGIDQWIKKHQTTAVTRELGTAIVTYNAAAKMLSMLSYAWAVGEDELKYLLFDYLVEGTGHLTGERHRLVTGGIQQAHVTISPTGWESIQNNPQPEGDTGFVAMWFNPDLADAYESAIHPAIEAAGYVPLRIDKKEHNNRIDDEIIAAVRSCHFLVADFTGSRGGVYYEAGFAGGLGTPVIWTVRDDHLKNVHFDTRQFNHIVWNQDELDEFRKALENRIVATIGRGPNV